MIFQQLPLLLWFLVFFSHFYEEIPQIYVTLLLKFPNSHIPTEVNCRDLRKKIGILEKNQLLVNPKTVGSSHCGGRLVDSVFNVVIIF